MVGQGYVGLPVAMRAVEVGFDVVGFDVSVERVEALARGESFVGDVSDATVAAALEAGYLPTFDAADLAGFDVAVISVPTPLRDGAPDLAYIEDAGRALGAHLRKGACVVLESTTYPGTTAELLGPILEEASGLVRGEYALGYSPERIDPGNETHTFVNTPKVTSGVDDASLAVVDAFFAALVDTTVAVGSPAEAELVKLLENTFRHVNIALVNELAMFARELGVDVWRAIDAASTKPFGYMRFTPGPGVGGHCLPIDPSYLAWRVKQHLGQTFRFVELAKMSTSTCLTTCTLELPRCSMVNAKASTGAGYCCWGLRTSGAPVTGGKALVFTLPLGWHRAAPKLFFATPTSLASMLNAPSFHSSTSPPTNSPRPTSWCCSSTTTSSTRVRLPSTPSWCSTRRT